MAETSDYSGWVPAGTPHYSGFATDVASGSPMSLLVDEWENMSAITALVILYVTLSDDAFSGVQDSLPQVQLLPVADSVAVTHVGGGSIWIGPGVRFYAC